jgi:membrane protein YqaA with SNARE-associated domain
MKAGTDQSMGVRRLERLLAVTLRQSARGRAFLLVCAGLAFGGTLVAAYPVTAVIVPATLLAPRRWRAIAAFAAIGSALGAVTLVWACHWLGWSELFQRFPHLASDPKWARVMDWVADYGIPALFAIAISPLPQTPALIFFGMARHDYGAVFLAILAGKCVKYGAVGWAASRFPERFAQGFRGYFRRRPKPVRDAAS